MIEAPLPEDEFERLAALHEMGLLDTPQEARFDRITRLAQRMFDVPIALISLVDNDRQWFKSKVGLEVDQTERCISFCGHALESDDIFVVEDASTDERFHDNPLVTGAPHVHFYAGQPLRSPTGYRIGTLCILDRTPRKFGSADRAMLRDIGLMAESELAPRQETAAHSKDRIYTRRLTSALGRNGLLKGLSKRPTALLLSGLTLLGILLLGSHWNAQNMEEHRLRQERRILEVTGLWRGKLESELNGRLHLVHGLAGLVNAGKEIDEATFQRFSGKLAGEMTAIRSLQLAPDGVVRFAWPLESNRAALGHDLLADPARRQTAETSIASRRIWIAGPLKLIQGGTALIGRQPIFLWQGPAAGEKFWGFATILIDLPQFLSAVELPETRDGIRFALRGTDSQGTAGSTFFGDPEIFETDSIRATVTLPAGSWQLGALPERGWASEWPGQKRFLLLGLGSAFVLSWLVYALLRLPAQLQRRIDAALALRAQDEQQFSDAIEALHEGFAIFDAADRLLVWNERFAEIHSACAPVMRAGISFEELTRYAAEHDQFMGLSVDDPTKVDAFISARMALHRRPEIRFEDHLRDGRWMQIVERRMRDGGTVSFHLDITELKQKEKDLSEARQRAEEANAAKDQFLATISHEIRTPLNSILGLIGLLKDSPNLQERERERAGTAHESAQQLLMIVNEILDLSKLREHRLKLEEGPFDPSETIAGVVRMVEGIVKTKGLEMNLRLETGGGSYVLGDEGRFRQVLLNVITNAVKFTDSGHIDVRLSTRPAGNGRLQAEVAVEDTGIGFTELDAEELFKPFHQIESAASRRFAGTGLGLSISRQLIELMGGEICAEGVPGVGARFFIRLTLPEAARPRGTDTPRALSQIPAECGWRTIRVLLVEDSPTNQLVFRALLEDTGYEVDAASSGEEALQLLSKLPYDLVMMDVFMPEMDGLETTRRLRELPACSGIPVIALTANAMHGDRERFLAAGMDDYLPKPIIKQDLLDTMGKWAAEVLQQESASTSNGSIVN